MENKKYSKIIVIALSIALLICAMLCVVANAESAPKILAKNIEYGDNLKFMVAVDPDSVGGEGKTVTFSVYEGAPENGKILGNPTTAVYQDTSETNLGIEYAYIGTSAYGVSPLAYGESYYLVVECDGVTTTTQYSVIEYFLERLYGDGIVNATEGAALLQKNVYENAIAYGSSVQKYAAYEGEFNGTNIEDYRYVIVDGGTANGVDRGVFASGTTLTLSANDKGWQATTVSDGVTTKIDGTSYTVEDNVYITTYVRPADLTTSYYTTQTAAGEVGFNYDNYAGTWTFNANNSSATYKFMWSQGYTGDNSTSVWQGQGLATVDGRGKVLALYKNGTPTSSASHRVPEIAFNNVNSADGNCLVFESDIYVHASTSDQITSSNQWLIRFGFVTEYDRNATSNLDNAIDYNEARGDFDTDNNTWGDIYVNDELFTLDAWNKLCVEYYKSEGIVKYYLNGYLVRTVEVPANTEIASFVLQLHGQTMDTVNKLGSYVYLDNTYMGTVNKTIAE